MPFFDLLSDLVVLYLIVALRSLSFNLRDESNPDLRSRVGGITHSEWEIGVKQFAPLSSDDHAICPRSSGPDR